MIELVDNNNAAGDEGKLTEFFFFNDTATTEIYTLSLHDALPIWRWSSRRGRRCPRRARRARHPATPSASSSPCCAAADRKSTRLNSSHANISYAVFCLKKKKNNNNNTSAAVFCLPQKRVGKQFPS